MTGFDLPRGLIQIVIYRVDWSFNDFRSDTVRRKSQIGQERYFVTRPQSSRWLATHSGGAMLYDTFAGFPGLLLTWTGCNVVRILQTKQALSLQKGRLRQ